MVFALAIASNVRTCLHAYIQNAILRTYARTHAYNYSYTLYVYVCTHILCAFKILYVANSAHIAIAKSS